MNKRMRTRITRTLVGLVGITSALGTVFTAAADDYASYKRYNKMGQVVAEIGPKNAFNGGDNRITTRYTYNHKGEMIRAETGRINTVVPAETIAPKDWSAAFSKDKEVFHFFNSAGEINYTDTKTGNGARLSRTVFKYDDYGRLTCQTQVMDPTSNTSICLSPGSNTADGYNRVTYFNYNDFDQITAEYRGLYTDNSILYKRYYYNGARMLSSVQDANDNRTSYEYDQFGRLEKVSYPYADASHFSNSFDYEFYTYDNNGNRKSLRKRSGDTIRYDYDNLNQLIKKDLPGTTKDIYYGYDLRGLPLYTVYYADSPTQIGVSRTYDGFGRITTESNRVLWHAPLVNEYEYDEHGNRDKFTYPDGKVIEYDYDEMNRITSMDIPGPSSDVTYTYNAQGLPEGIQRPNNTNSQYTYDDGLRIETATDNLNGSASDNIYTFTYNPANQIKTLSVSNQNYAVDHLAQGTPGNYVTNGLNQYTQVNGHVVDYDQNGNLTLDESEDAVYEYSDENQLTKAIVGNTTTELGYDPTGRLLNVGNTYFLYDGEAVIAEYNQPSCYPCSRTMTKRYVHSVGVDNPIAEYGGSATSQYNITYLHRNYQGSIIAGSNSGGYLVYNNNYDTFGVPEPTNQGRFAYTGQMYLDEIGLYYYKARIYNPKLGRFMQTDPIGYEDGMNWYAYVNSDPVNNIDPSGMSLIFSNCRNNGQGGQMCGASKTDDEKHQERKEQKAAEESEFKTVGAISNGFNESLTFTGGRKIKLNTTSTTLGLDQATIQVGMHPIDSEGNMIIFATNSTNPTFYEQALIGGFNTGLSATVDASILGWDTSIYSEFRWTVKIPTQKQIHQNSTYKYVEIQVLIPKP